jgi:hypothetical protein
VPPLYPRFRTSLERGTSKIDYVIAVVVGIDKDNVVISTGKRRKEQLESKIKMAGSPLYLKGEEDGSLTHGTGG